MVLYFMHGKPHGVLIKGISAMENNCHTRLYGSRKTSISFHLMISEVIKFDLLQDVFYSYMNL
jgi:hypothetical protein